MLRSFNSGIGMVLVVGKDDALEVRAALEKAGERVVLMGEMIPAADSKVVYEGTLE